MRSTGPATPVASDLSRPTSPTSPTVSSTSTYLSSPQDPACASYGCALPSRRLLCRFSKSERRCSTSPCRRLARLTLYIGEAGYAGCGPSADPPPPVDYARVLAAVQAPCMGKLEHLEVSNIGGNDALVRGRAPRASRRVPAKKHRRHRVQVEVVLRLLV